MKKLLRQMPLIGFGWCFGLSIFYYYFAHSYAQSAVWTIWSVFCLIVYKIKQYEWFENKKLKKIEPKTEENKGDIRGISPNWSIEDEAEKEKYDFVSGQFIECRKSFNEFKEDNSYWLEYIGDDTYIGRSDNILNQKFHITPRQLFTLFTWQHRPKEGSNVNDETNAPTE